MIPLNQVTGPLDLMFGENIKLQCDLAVTKSIFELGLPPSIVEQVARVNQLSTIYWKLLLELSVKRHVILKENKRPACLLRVLTINVSSKQEKQHCACVYGWSV